MHFSFCLATCKASHPKIPKKQKAPLTRGSPPEAPVQAHSSSMAKAIRSFAKGINHRAHPALKLQDRLIHLFQPMFHKITTPQLGNPAPISEHAFEPHVTSCVRGNELWSEP
jgi:hypothetical protein